MLIHPTLDQMHQLGLAGMARAFTELEANPQSADLSHAEWLALLLDREATDRYERRLRARLRYARLRHQAAVEDVDYRAARGLDRALFQALTAGKWIDEAQNLIIEGPAGVGKSWLACALGQKACRDNRSVLYQRVPRMFGDLALARGDGRYPRLMRALGGVKLLILDDWGLEPLGPEQRHDMLEIVEDRYGRGATLITSQIPVDRWHDLIGEPTLADAILDRIVHNAHRLQLTGDSLRKQKAAENRRRLTQPSPLWRDHIRPAGDPPPRPTSIGTAGRLRSEQVADINRNARPTSSESAPWITGRIVAVPIVDNQTVTKGTPLAEIDPTPFQLSLAQQQAEPVEAEAQLAVDHDLIKSAKAARDEADARARLANDNLARARPVANEGFLSRQALDVTTTGSTRGRRGAR